MGGHGCRQHRREQCQNHTHRLEKEQCDKSALDHSKDPARSHPEYLVSMVRVTSPYYNEQNCAEVKLPTEISTAHADIVLSNATVVTMDPSYSIIRNGAVAIQGDTIAAVGGTDTVSRQFQASEVLDCTGLTIIPGMINAHTHAAMTLLRGLADDLRLDVWLIGYMMPTEREFVDPEFVSLGTSLACAEMIQSGVTTFCDMYYFEDTVAEATAAAGMRAILGQTVLKFPSPDAESYESSLRACREFIEKWKGHPLIIPAVAPHAPYTTTPEILEACTQLALEFDVPIHIHLSETALEVLESRRHLGMPVIPWVKKQGIRRESNRRAMRSHR
jgi:5-methylthioadenosine/S-adenosylhomocysteine deaminase